ncbi:hypothetical protein [Paenibacillus lutimineralis]|uniref:hypothetical protein n=1 Tax=Paenibacillus lutimineralis TaxID=2707005 RepID=UPI0026D2EBBF
MRSGKFGIMAAAIDIWIWPICPLAPKAASKSMDIGLTREILKHGGSEICARKQAYLVLDDWLFLPVAYLSIEEEPEVIQQMALSFVGKFVSLSTSPSLSWIDEEALRFARRVIRPFRSEELALHLNRSDRQARRILDKLVKMEVLLIHNGQQRYCTYQLVKNDR